MVTNGDSKIRTVVERVTALTDSKFQHYARDPRVLAFVAASMNYASAMLLERRKYLADLKSIRAQVKTKLWLA